MEELFEEDSIKCIIVKKKDVKRLKKKGYICKKWNPVFKMTKEYYVEITDENYHLIDSSPEELSIFDSSNIEIPTKLKKYANC